MGAQGGIGMDRYSSLAESGRSLDLTEFQFHSGCLDRKEEARERERRPGRLCQMRNTYYV